MSARDVIAATIDHPGFDQRYRLTSADAILADLRAAGYAVVPTEPTNAMLDAGATPGWSRWETHGRYRAMIAAAQKPGK